jgi:hypothetical protein
MDIVDLFKSVFVSVRVGLCYRRDACEEADGDVRVPREVRCPSYGAEYRGSS